MDIDATQVIDDFGVDVTEESRKDGSPVSCVQYSSATYDHSWFWFTSIYGCKDVFTVHASIFYFLFPIS